ncbi:MAG: hypothetical protein JJE42_16015, partial [Burkholderiales bacterium]|nr:hypothetical protein [Burkholderiales bacterium]
MSFVLDEHLSYVADAVRLERFKAAFGKVVKRGDCIADLGSGSGMDVFFAAVQVGAQGSVVGVDFTAEQL